MRGTSKREDSAFWIIRVDEVKGRATHERGARFQTVFTKQRNNAQMEWMREWTVQTQDNGQVSFGCTELSFDGKVLQLIQDGLSSASDIAQELGCVKSTVCKAANRLETQKLIEKHGGNRFTKYKPRAAMKSTDATF